jgi:hypothetical protein
MLELACKEFESRRLVSFGKGKYLKREDITISLSFVSPNAFNKVINRVGEIDNKSINKFGIALCMASEDKFDTFQALVYLAQIDDLFEKDRFKSAELANVISKIRKVDLTKSNIKTENKKNKTTPSQVVLQMVFGKHFEKAQELSSN